MTTINNYTEFCFWELFKLRKISWLRSILHQKFRCTTLLTKLVSYFKLIIEKIVSE